MRLILAAVTIPLVCQDDVRTSKEITHVNAHFIIARYASEGIQTLSWSASCVFSHAYVSQIQQLLASTINSLGRFEAPFTYIFVYLLEL